MKVLKDTLKSVPHKGHVIKLDMISEELRLSECCNAVPLLQLERRTFTSTYERKAFEALIKFHLANGQSETEAFGFSLKTNTSSDDVSSVVIRHLTTGLSFEKPLHKAVFAWVFSK